MRVAAIAVILLVLVLTVGCSAPAKKVTTQEQVIHHIATHTLVHNASRGLQPAALIASSDIDLLVTTDRPIQLVNRELGINQTIITPNVQVTIPVRNATSGNYTIKCIHGCTARQNTFTLIVQ
jgi:hypothetical protein